MTEINYDNLEPFNYFINYKNFIQSIVPKIRKIEITSGERNGANEESANDIEKNSIKFIKCLCKVYIGQVIHCKIQSKLYIIVVN